MAAKPIPVEFSKITALEKISGGFPGSACGSKLPCGNLPKAFGEILLITATDPGAEFISDTWKWIVVRQKAAALRLKAKAKWLKPKRLSAKTAAAKHPRPIRERLSG